MAKERENMSSKEKDDDDEASWGGKGGWWEKGSWDRRSSAAGHANHAILVPKLSRHLYFPGGIRNSRIIKMMEEMFILQSTYTSHFLQSVSNSHERHSSLPTGWWGWKAGKERKERYICISHHHEPQDLYYERQTRSRRRWRWRWCCHKLCRIFFADLFDHDSCSSLFHPKMMIILLFVILLFLSRVILSSHDFFLNSPPLVQPPFDPSILHHIFILFSVVKRFKRFYFFSCFRKF